MKSQCAFKNARAEIAAENGILKIFRETEEGGVTAYFNTGGRTKKLEVNGSIIFSLNYKKGRLLNDGTVVIKNIKS